MRFFQKKDPVMEKAARVQGKKTFLNDGNPRRKYRRNLKRVTRLKNRLGEMDSNHPQRESIRLELKRRLVEIEEYEYRNGIGREE